jgi:hypothetical protein
LVTGVLFQAGTTDISLLHSVHIGSGAHAVSNPLGVKWQGREADHLPPSSAEIHSPHTCPWCDACTGANLPSFISASVLVCLHNPPTYPPDLISDSCGFSQPNYRKQNRMNGKRGMCRPFLACFEHITFIRGSFTLARFLYS